MSGFAHRISTVWGNFLPDKEFRYLRHTCYSFRDDVNHFDESRETGQIISAWLLMSP